MAVNAEFLKDHWKLLAGSFVGVFLLLYLLKHGSASADSGGSSDISGGANVNQNLQAAASLQNAQSFTQTSIAAYQAGVIDNQTQAGLQAHLADTAASLAAAQQKTSADLAVSLDTNSSAVSIQRLQSEQAIKTTALQGETLTNLVSTAAQAEVQIAQGKNAIDMAQIGLQTHIYDTLASKNKLGGDSTGVATIISGVYGRGPEAIGAQQPSEVANSSGAILSGLSGIISGASRALLA